MIDDSKSQGDNEEKQDINKSTIIERTKRLRIVSITFLFTYTMVVVIGLAYTNIYNSSTKVKNIFMVLALVSTCLFLVLSYVSTIMNTYIKFDTNNRTALRKYNEERVKRNIRNGRPEPRNTTIHNEKEHGYYTCVGYIETFCLCHRYHNLDENIEINICGYPVYIIQKGVDTQNANNGSDQNC